MFSRISIKNQVVNRYVLIDKIRRLSIVPLIVNGKEIVTKESYPVYSPTTNEIIHEFSYLTSFEETIPLICSTAEEGFKEWSNKSYLEKSKILRQAVELFRSRKEYCVRAHEQIGGPTWFARYNIEGLVGQLEEYVNQLSQPDGILPKTATTDLALTVRQPIGPVLAISPWNAPVILSGRSIAAPLAAGCSVVIKSSEKSPLLSYLVVKSFLDAGVPSKALQLVNIRPEDTAEFTDLILKSQTIRKVSFTGSTQVGKKIAMTAAKYLKPYLLELGGKNFSIIEKDADIKKSVGNILWSSWCHKGQICMSIDKVFIHDSIYDQYIKELINAAREIAKDPDYLIPQRDPSFTRKIDSLINDALDKGARILFGEKSDTSQSNVISPLILEGVTPEMLVNSTETFGPLFAVYKYTDIDELIDKLNKDSFGLKASIWSTNIVNAIKIAKKIEAGGVHINSSTIHDEPTIPHGGVKESGVGRFNSSWGIHEFSFTKSITLNE